ncbi:RtcB family protein [Methylovulum psychrotolerans]|uniref:3'-phosphate/5'-hydroxy nucleic acid ligase n=1 Tax=Methylovulum psychrotolerans TaxID=1704499 RepID=A0A1Z4BU06_9GAMM|nr:RtcB family protein [Methylovulum psychrotolerans]ASF44806.1 RNA-splicing ligase RtcB [Methylovulum psychrotolerans]MBT9099475.1 RtcB family protein [Methylovulum psychrotolerans]POZ52040.1 RtcB family protein [Methylovulum psychrotolerans]
MSQPNYEVTHVSGGVPIKTWTRGVPFEEQAREQLINISRLPFIHKWIAAMPDVHLGKGATVGSVVPTLNAIIPAAVGVDIGCGMMAVKTEIRAEQLPDSLRDVRHAIERAVPHGRDMHPGRRDKGSWHDLPEEIAQVWNLQLAEPFSQLCEKHKVLKNTNNAKHLGTLGTGNHFIEVCLDESDAVWVMLHSGSRGVGNRIGTHFIELAQKEMQRWFIQLPDRDLAYLPEGSEYFADYVQAVEWAQRYAQLNRDMMMQRVLSTLSLSLGLNFNAQVAAVNCHHNYVSREHHYGKDVLLTRKGAVRAGLGEWGIIPGSMGAKSFIVRGLGNEESFCSCSHGAGRVMSRTAAIKNVSVAEHVAATEGVECRKDKSVIDETPSAYKPIEQVMAAQSDLVEIMHTLKQVVCVKG